MPTINAEITKTIVENDGVYPGDPQVYAVHTYENQWGGLSYHIAYNGNEVRALILSPACFNIKRVWDRVNKLTPYGSSLTWEDR